MLQIIFNNGNRYNNVAFHQPETSHITFRFSNEEKLTIPAYKPIKPIYIQQFITLLDKLLLGALKMSDITYPMIIRPLTKKEGGGFLAEFPDLPGCIADGETVEEAVAEAADALQSWLATAKTHHDLIPLSSAEFSGQCYCIFQKAYTQH